MPARPLPDQATPAWRGAGSLFFKDWRTASLSDGFKVWDR